MLKLISDSSCVSSIVELTFVREKFNELRIDMKNNLWKVLDARNTDSSDFCKNRILEASNEAQ